MFNQYMVSLPITYNLTLENSTNMAHFEERDRYIQLVGEFLSD